MKRMMIKHGNKALNLLLLFFILFSVSCDRNETPLPDNNEVGKKFVYETTPLYYLWEEHIPANININDYSDPFKLFEAMYYPTLDKWSFVTDDFEGLINSLNGIRKASGFKFSILENTNESNDVFIVDYVHTDGQAYDAGLKRGDIIMEVNGQVPTQQNYGELFNTDQLELKIGELVDGNVNDLGKTLTMSKIEQSFNPILKQQVIETGGKKIGYFLYDQFISDYDEEMINVFSSFKSQGVDELVLDFRYNPGGYTSTCALLGSMIVPSVNLDDIFLTYEWNDIITNDIGGNPDYEHLFTVYFPESTVNLNLSTVYVLTSNHSASASEAIINCLKPYMNVVVIGEQTAGKYTSVNIFYDLEEPRTHDWAIFLVTSRIANADGVTDYVNGFAPDYPVEDDHITMLGDPMEPLLAQAISLITGTVTKSTRKLPEHFKSVGPVYENWMEKEGIFINDVKIPKK